MQPLKLKQLMAYLISLGISVLNDRITNLIRSIIDGGDIYYGEIVRGKLSDSTRCTMRFYLTLRDISNFVYDKYKKTLNLNIADYEGYEIDSMFLFYKVCFNGFLYTIIPGSISLGAIAPDEIGTKLQYNRHQYSEGYCAYGNSIEELKTDLDAMTKKRK
jgi:hypothetical protein